MTTTTRPDLATYADVLCRLIAEDRFDDPTPFAGITTWEQLDGICDANCYLIAADEETGNPSPFDTDGEVDIDALNAYGAFTSAAIDIAEKALARWAAQ